MLCILQPRSSFVRILSLEPLTSSHLPAVLTLDQLTLGGFWTEDGYQREIDSPNSDLLIFKEGWSETLSSHSNNSSAVLAIGCFWAILEEAHITLLAVHPDYRRLGLGQAMLLTLLQAAHRRQLERATLEVRVSNQAAIALYEKFGFQTAGTRKRYYQDTGEDALVLWQGGLHRPPFPAQLATWQAETRDRLHHAGWQLPSL